MKLNRYLSQWGKKNPETQSWLIDFGKRRKLDSSMHSAGVLLRALPCHKILVGREGVISYTACRRGLLWVDDVVDPK